MHLIIKQQGWQCAVVLGGKGKVVYNWLWITQKHIKTHKKEMKRKDDYRVM